MNLFDRDYNSDAMLSRLREKRRRSRSRAWCQGPGLVVGRRQADASLVVLPDLLLDQTSQLVTGPSGFGKTFYLYCLACQQIMRQRGGLLVIDPHGHLVAMLKNFCCAQRVDPKRLLVIQPLLRYAARLNPLQSFGALGSGTVLATQALIRTCGETTLQQTPRLGLNLKAGCLALESNNLPLALLPWFYGLGEASAAFRARLLPNISDPFCRHVLEELATFSKRDQLEHLESSVNRVAPFLATESMRRLVTWNVGNIDWKGVMDADPPCICLIDLGNVGGAVLSDQEKQLVAILAEHGVLHDGLRRQANVSRPFLVIIDETGSVMTEDLASSLDQLRKFGISFVLSHQRKDQIEAVSRNVWSSMVTNCQIKAVFGGLCRDDAECLARELFTGQFSPGDEVKYETRAVSFKPVIRWQDIVSVSEGGGTSTGGTASRGGTSGQSSSATVGTSAVYSADGIFCLGPTGWTYSESFQEAQSQSESWSESETWSQSRTWGRTNTRVPVTEFEQFLQEPSRQFYSLDESWEKRIALVKSLPKRTIALNVPGCGVELVKTLTVAERIAPPAMLEAYVEQACLASPNLGPAPAADEELNRLLACQGLLPVSVPTEPSTFAVPDQREEKNNDRTAEDPSPRTTGLPRGKKRRGVRRTD